MQKQKTARTGGTDNVPPFAVYEHICFDDATKYMERRKNAMTNEQLNTALYKKMFAEQENTVIGFSHSPPRKS